MNLYLDLFDCPILLILLLFCWGRKRRSLCSYVLDWFWLCDGVLPKIRLNWFLNGLKKEWDVTELRNAAFASVEEENTLRVSWEGTWDECIVSYCVTLLVYIHAIIIIRNIAINQERFIAFTFKLHLNIRTYSSAEFA